MSYIKKFNTKITDNIAYFYRIRKKLEVLFS